MNLLRTPTGRGVLFTVLYFSEGAPIGFIWWALPTMLRSQGEPVDRITGLTALLILPWTLKFLWAPLVDCLRSSRFGFRAWIMTAQLFMGLALLPLIGLDLGEHFGWWTVLLLVHALAAATQDVAVDALAIRCVPASERGRINACMQAGMLLGRSVFAGGALWFASRMGFPVVLLALTGCVWFSMALLWRVREPDETVVSGPARWTQFKNTLAGALAKRTTWVGLGFALMGGAAFEVTGALAGPYLIDHGFTQDEVGVFYALPVVVVTLLGGCGGPLSDRIGRTRAVGWFLFGIVVLVLTLAGRDHFMPEATGSALLYLLVLLYFFIGLFTASSYALFMDLTDPKLGATQFSAYMAATNGCEAWSARAGGLIAHHGSYAVSFLALSMVSLCSLIFLPFLSSKRTPQSNRSG